jgi:hypothetical protein
MASVSKEGLSAENRKAPYQEASDHSRSNTNLFDNTPKKGKKHKENVM